MNDNHYTVLRAMRHSPVSVILMAYCFISLWFVGGLTGFHLYLISTNQVCHASMDIYLEKYIYVFFRSPLYFSYIFVNVPWLLVFSVISYLLMFSLCIAACSPEKSLKPYRCSQPILNKLVALAMCLCAPCIEAICNIHGIFLRRLWGTRFKLQFSPKHQAVMRLKFKILRASTPRPPIHMHGFMGKIPYAFLSFCMYG